MQITGPDGVPVNITADKQLFGRGDCGVCGPSVTWRHLLCDWMGHIHCHDLFASTTIFVERCAADQTWELSTTCTLAASKGCFG